MVPEYDVDWALFLSGLESARLIWLGLREAFLTPVLPRSTGVRRTWGDKLQ